MFSKGFLYKVVKNPDLCGKELNSDKMSDFADDRLKVIHMVEFIMRTED